MTRSRKNKGASKSHGRPSDAKPRNKKRGGRKGRARATGPRMSMAGKSFLECAFAPPDFNVDPGQGIPDSYAGKTLMRKDVLTKSISAPAARDVYYLVAPTPGVAYWTCTIDPSQGTGAPTSTTVWSAVEFPGAFGATSLYGSSGSARASNVDGFRHASLCAGLYPTSNQMTFSGSVQVWKVPLVQASENRATTVNTTPAVVITTSELVLSGLESTSIVPPENYSHSFIDGVYTVSGNNQPDFPFRSILENYESLPPSAVDAAPRSGMYGRLDGPYLGYGDTDAIVIKVSSGANADNSFVLKVWSCLELRVNTSSPLYQYAGASPNHDPVAIEVYRRALAKMPLAVICAENARFWETMVRIIRSVAGAASYVPGPVGVIGTSVGAITDAVSALFE